jgi:hypothetical protein
MKIKNILIIFLACTLFVSGTFSLLAEEKNGIISNDSDSEDLDSENVVIGSSVKENITTEPIVDENNSPQNNPENSLNLNYVNDKGIAPISNEKIALSNLNHTDFMKYLDLGKKSSTNDVRFYNINNDDLTDRYVQCGGCGGYIPVGNVNKPLPSSALCLKTEHCAETGLVGYENSVSYDDALTWENPAQNAQLEKAPEKSLEDSESEKVQYVDVEDLPIDSHEKTNLD